MLSVKGSQLGSAVNRGLETTRPFKRREYKYFTLFCSDRRSALDKSFAPSSNEPLVSLLLRNRTAVALYPNL